jgi:serine/threonine-protein kinase
LLRGQLEKQAAGRDLKAVGPVDHRDVTPQNILLATNGVAKLSDFGLARAMDRGRTTSPGVVKGKIAYLAPELTRGEQPSVQSDIFSMGVVLWEALAGRALYEGPTDVDVFQLAREAEVPPLASLRDDLPSALLRAVECALAPRPEDRFGSARRFLRALTRTLREVDQSTDSYALAQSVIEARCILGAPPPFILAPPPAGMAPSAGNSRASVSAEILCDGDLLEVREGDEPDTGFAAPPPAPAAARQRNEQ